MPRRPTVSRTRRMLDVLYTYYDSNKKSIEKDTERLSDYRMSENLIKAKIEKKHSDRKVVSIEKLTTRIVTYYMSMEDFIAKANIKD